MPSIIIPRQWTSQPQGIVGINRANPLGATITHCIPCSLNPREIVGKKFVVPASGFDRSLDLRGYSIKSAGSAACASVPLNLSGVTKLSLSFWLWWDTYAANDNFAMEHTASASSNAGFWVDPNDSTTGNKFSFRISAADLSRNVRTIARPSAAAWHHYVVLFDYAGYADPALSIPAIYVDGVLQSQTAVSNNLTAGGSFTNDTLYLFSRNNSSLFGAGRLQNIVFRAGYLMSAQEVLNEYQNPWQIFQSNQLRIFFGGAASPATFKAAWSSNQARVFGGL